MNFDWVCSVDTSKRKVVQELFPQEHKYRVTSYELISASDILEESKFTIY